jgi:hypothetical protein
VNEIDTSSVRLACNFSSRSLRNDNTAPEAIVRRIVSGEGTLSQLRLPMGKKTHSGENVYPALCGSIKGSIIKSQLLDKFAEKQMQKTFVCLCLHLSDVNRVYKARSFLIRIRSDSGFLKKVSFSREAVSEV